GRGEAGVAGTEEPANTGRGRKPRRLGVAAVRAGGAHGGGELPAGCEIHSSDAESQEQRAAGGDSARRNRDAGFAKQPTGRFATPAQPVSGRLQRVRYRQLLAALYDQLASSGAAPHAGDRSGASGSAVCGDASASWSADDLLHKD